MASKLSEAELQRAVHELEASRSVLAIIAVAPLAFFALLISLGSLLMIPALVVVVGRLTEATLRGGAVEVSDENFPEIADDIELMSERLGYDKPVRAFIIQGGTVNALLWRVFGRKFIALNSGLVSSLTRTERQFVIARFVGALRARHLRFHEAAAIVSAFENLKILNALVLPYLRASVYTGDRFGALAVGDPEASTSAMKKLLVGEALASEVSLVGLTSQGHRLRASPFRTLAILFSSHPHMTDRFLELQLFLDREAREFLPPPTVQSPAAVSG